MPGALSTSIRRATALGSAVLVGGCSVGTSPISVPTMPAATLVRVAGGFESPVGLAFPPGSNAPFVVEQAGQIMRRSSEQWTPVLDIRLS